MSNDVTDIDLSDPHDLGDKAWPVYAKRILSPREQTLFQRLRAAFPDYSVHAQVALSQLIDVPDDHPDRHAVRNRFSQLVADLVVCRPDLSIVAVIELDDRTHFWAHRKYADARKNKALNDAGLRLIRIPAGTMPDEAALIELLKDNANLQYTTGIAEPPDPRISAESQHLFPKGSRPQGDWLNDHAMKRRAETTHAAEDRELLRPVAVCAVAIIGGWFLYSLLLRAHAPNSSIIRPAPPIASRLASTPVSPPLSAQQAQASVGQRLADEKREVAAAAMQRQQVADGLARRREQAWQRFYIAPASCEHPPTWKDQVECGNLYIRAKKQFEAAWQGS